MDFDKLDGTIWFDGDFVPAPEANVHVLSHSLHFASAVFEGIRSYGGRPFKLEEHTDRLFESARIVDIEIPFTREELNNACLECLDRNKISDGYIRPVVWRGPQSMAPVALETKVHVAIAVWEWPNFYSAEAREKGISLTIANWRRPSPDSAPTQSKASGLYQICTLAKHAAMRRGFDDALMLDYRGLIAETTSSNIFFVKNGSLLTPVADCFLDGITRQSVLMLAGSLDIPVFEKHLEPSLLDEADEVFITGTAAEITPVGVIDERRYAVGEVTNRLAEAFHEIVHETSSARVSPADPPMGNDGVQ